MAKNPEKMKNAVQDQDGDVARELGDTLNKRFQKISGQGEEKKGLGKFFSLGDSTKTILKSIEASMFVQTEFLEKINNNIKEQLEVQKNVVSDQERADRLASVSEGEDDSDSDNANNKPEKKEESFSEKAKNFLKDKTSAFVPQEEDSLSMKLLKGLGLITGAGYIASGFGKNLSEKAFKKIPGVSDEGADKASTITGDALGTGTSAGIGSLLLKKFGLTRIGGLKAFATAAVAKATYDTIGELDVDKDGKLLGINKELVQGVGAGIAGIGTFVGLGASFSALNVAVRGSLNFAKSKLGMKVKPDVPKTPKAPNLEQMTKGANKPSVPKVTTTSSKVAKAVTKIPSAITVGPAGTAVQQTINSSSSIDAVGDAVKASKPERFAKFAKFFRFAGPAAAIIPALIEPALAIYNDEPDSVVRKEIAGAVGSISGGSLGLLAGSSAGATLGLGAAGVGAVPGGIIGGFIGGLGGAFAGEWLAEKVTDALMGGPEVDPKDINKLIDEKKDKSGGITPSANISSADIAPTSEQKVADAQVKADDAGKALSDFESSAKSARTVQKEDAFGDIVEGVVYDDAAEQAQFDKLSDAKYDADYAVEDATSEMITGDSFDVPGQFEKLMFLQDKGFLPEGESKIEMGKFVGGPLSGMTPDEAISMYVTQNSSTSKAAAEFKAGDKSVPTIEADPTKPMTEDGKIPARVAPATGKSAELQAAQDKTTESFQAIKDFEIENASMMTKEDRGNGMYAPKFSDPEKQKEYNALFDQAMMDKEAEEREQALEAVDRGGKTEDYTRTGNLTQFRDEEAGSLSALKNLQSAEKEREDFMSQMGVKDLDDIQDPMMKEKAKELRTKHAKAKKAYRSASRDQLGSRMDSSVFGGRSNYMDRRQTLMTQYGMNEEDMNKLGIVRDEFGGSKDRLQTKLEAFKRQKDEEKLEQMSKGITGVESMPDRLVARAKVISEDKATQDSQAKGIMMQNLNKAGDSVNTTNVGGSSNTVNVLSGGGGRSLANHTPVSQSN
ncbi:hypothetical protein OAG36_00420 [bacterium]|nr:hypothetical protein [bacterium]